MIISPVGMSPEKRSSLSFRLHNFETDFRTCSARWLEIFFFQEPILLINTGFHHLFAIIFLLLTQVQFVLSSIFLYFYSGFEVLYFEGVIHMVADSFTESVKVMIISFKCSQLHKCLPLRCSHRLSVLAGRPFRLLVWLFSMDFLSAVVLKLTLVFRRLK